jgi:hypothetical protein
VAKKGKGRKIEIDSTFWIVLAVVGIVVIGGVLAFVLMTGERSGSFAGEVKDAREDLGKR